MRARRKKVLWVKQCLLQAVSEDRRNALLQPRGELLRVRGAEAVPRNANPNAVSGQSSPQSFHGHALFEVGRRQTRPNCRMRLMFRLKRSRRTQSAQSDTPKTLTILAYSRWQFT